MAVIRTIELPRCVANAYGSEPAEHWLTSGARAQPLRDCSEPKIGIIR